jgi:hypothetical protein
MVCDEDANSLKSNDGATTNQPYFFVNAQVHQDESKMFAGFGSASYSDSVMQTYLYHFTWPKTISKNVAHVSLWR